MKKALALVVSLISSNAFSATTTGGYVACLSQEWLNNMTSFVSTKDKASFTAYIESEKCFIVGKGVQVTVVDSPGVFGAQASFIFKGVKFWTVREGLDYSN